MVPCWLYHMHLFLPKAFKHYRNKYNIKDLLCKLTGTTILQTKLSYLTVLQFFSLFFHLKYILNLCVLP